MFIGRYYHNLESKGRLAIPKAFRQTLKSGGVITQGLDGCLFLFPTSSFKQLSSKLASLPLTSQAARQFTRLLIQQAAPLEMDRQGRTLLPLHLRQLANLKLKVVVAGALTRIEIWDQETYHSHLNKLEQLTPQIQEELSNLGI